MGRNPERSAIPAKVRAALPKCCCNCGSTENLHFHHIVPVIYGGRNIPSNIAVVCESCHSHIHYGENGEILSSTAIKKGVAKAKERGVHFGKKPADYERIMQIIAENSTRFNPCSWMTENEVAELAGCGYSTLCKVKKMLIEDMNSDNWEHSFPKPTICKAHADSARLLRGKR